MSHCTTLALTGLAALFMSVAVSTASANRLSVSSQSFRAVWSELTFFGEGGIEAEMKCPLTLEGSFHSTTMSKVLGGRSGYVTRAISGSGAACRRGSSTVLRETLPWKTSYQGFSGTLPRITRIRMVLTGASYIIEPGIGIGCRYGSVEEITAGEINLGAGGEANSVTADNTSRIRGQGEFGCPPEGGAEGTTTTLTVLGATTRITIRLI